MDIFQEIFAKMFSYFCFSMKIYDLKNSHIDKFQDNEIVFYENPNGNCFLGNQLDILGKLMDS
ncbi:hypothetical protein REIP_1312 [Rickettsia endosymbiont of Ixodes pacificus]|nr:hypothetical protein REIP_1312 [Rickettsia endosymbiont of Ixodes pacificus]